MGWHRQSYCNNKQAYFWPTLYMLPTYNILVNTRNNYRNSLGHFTKWRKSLVISRNGRNLDVHIKLDTRTWTGLETTSKASSTAKY